MEIKRRDFIRTFGAAGAGLLVFNPVISAFSRDAQQLARYRNSGQWIASSCSGCTTWCPIQVFVQNGRAVKVRGNPFSQTNPGTVCPKGHLAIQEVYDPDRIKVPMKRTNPVKGNNVNPGFVPITWDEALDTIATKLMDLRTANEPEKYLFLRGRYNYNNDIFYNAFNKIFGTPNAVSHSAICAEAEKLGYAMTENIWGYRDYDLDNTKFLVLWGVDPFRSNRGIPAAMSKWDQLRKNKAKMVVIDPVMTGAATKAYKWLPVIPGEDGALASALAHHILVNDLWHKGFVGNYNGVSNIFVANQTANEVDFTENFTKGLVKWWNIELKDKTPAWAANICGISKESIEELAEQMAANAPNVCIWSGPGPVMAPRGGYTAMAINALNGLLGSIRNIGGTMKRPSAVSASVPSYSAYQDSIATTGLGKQKMDQKGYLKFPMFGPGAGKGSSVNNVANAILASDPYDIKVCIAYFVNLPFSATNPQRWENALANKIPFFAHITTHASEMTMFADIVLPAAHSGMERWGFLKTASNLHGETTLLQPVATRLFSVKDDETEIPWLLAKKLYDKGYQNIYNYFSTEIKDPETNATATNETEFSEIVTKFFTYPAYNAQGDKWNTFKLKGVSATAKAQYFEKWNDFGTVSKKFEFYSETLKKELEAHAVTKHATTVDNFLTQINYTAQGEAAFVPHYEPPFRWGSKVDYPYTFIDSKSRYNREGRSANAPWYYMFKKLDPGDTNWEDCIKINPTDASALGIVDGDMVKVTSVIDEIIVKAKLFEGIRPGTVAKTYGMGHTVYGRFASGDFANFAPNGGNNNRILPDDYERLTGSTARNGGYCGVKLQKV